ncbi:phage tail protein [Neisseria sp. HMSC064F04]|jgi:phage tail sheath protein|uniref:phage tail sheath subtilisin-like domain-containing protein n=1 Tax=Neisseria mucosa TaxID=488 RepID=UPI0008A9ACEA|nr:phage tail sheath subtilisin-like domain-containing protein [Neisseria mucosa]OHR40331.1 phage tail protein [Neisseria sp. HMSC064F04]
MTAKRMHGVTANEYTHGARAISDIATNIIGIVATGNDADTSAFPLNTPIFSTSVGSLIDRAGSQGTLAKSLDAIHDQADAQIVVVRVADTEDESEKKQNVINGAKQLAKASAYTGFKPKIIGAPELDDADVTAELVVAANALDAFVYASAGGSQDITSLGEYRKGFGQKNLMLIDNDFMVLNPAAVSTATGQGDISANTLTAVRNILSGGAVQGQTNTVTTAATIARILGARAMLDEKVGPHKSISNTEIQGVSAIKYPRSFGLLDINSEANTLNNLDVTTLIREKGFRVWGNRTCSADPIWAFEPTVRVASIIKETIAESFLWAMDKPMHPSLMIDIINTINAKLAEKVYKGWLLGAQVFIDPKKIEKERVSNGIFAFDYEFTVAPPLENIELNQHVSDRFIVNLTDRVIEFASNIKPTTV